MEEEEEYESEDNYSNLPDNIDIEDKRPPPAQHHRESGSVEKSLSIILGGETGKNSKEFGSMQSSNKLKALSENKTKSSKDEAYSDDEYNYSEDEKNSVKRPSM